ncbi:MAG: amino acid permease [Proteobacteria bacterium]|nr:amino acid permease [Pseudomonadota bacterium]
MMESKTADRDAEQLRALGYVSHFDRSMSIWENFALGFTYLSPVVGVYTIFATTFAAGGPPMWWTYLLVGMGQLLVCLVFGEVVSQFPISGGIYPWARRLLGTRWAWMAGWIYGWALFVTLAAIATGAAPFLAQLLGIAGTPVQQTVIAVVLIVLVTALNLSGTRLLARFAMFGFICELIGAIAVGSYLLLFARHQPLRALIDTQSLHLQGSYLPAFLASALGAMFCYYGFEACGDVAEETPDASRTIPKSMRLTIYVGGVAALWVCLALVLAVPDIQAVLSGRDKDPVVTILRSAMGETGLRAVIAIVTVSFVSALLSLQAAASRLLFAYARDQMVFGSEYLRHLSPGRHIPAKALIVSGTIPVLISVSALWMQNAIATIISFASVGIYLAFQMIVVAALIARGRGWKPGGAFTLGAWGWPVNLAALAYGLAAIVNMSWPRSPTEPWFTNYGVVATSLGIIALGLIYMLVGRPYDRGQAPAGDAHRLEAVSGELVGD